MMKNIRRIFRSYCKNKGLRYTPEREMIIDQIYNVQDHFDVDELYLRLREHDSKISKASIYRLIPLLLDSGLLREAYAEDGHQHYEPLYGYNHHDHLRCIGCGKIVEFIDDTIESAQQQVGKQHGFTIINHSMEILGYCESCMRIQVIIQE